jgi:signal transduction histidine kinase
VHRDGRAFPVEVSLSPVDHVGLFTGYIRDVSELRILQRQILRWPADEQWRIGQALHDGPLQHLTGLGLLVKTLAQDMETSGSSNAEAVADLNRRLADIIAQSRDIARGMISMQIGAGGLASTLEELCRRIGRETSIACSVIIDEDLMLGSGFISDQIYHIALEAVTNAVKHSNAKNISITLGSVDGSVALRIVDDGIGIDLPDDDAAGDTGLGLRIMAHRASVMAGTLRIYRSSTGGTVVSCTVPIVGNEF